MIESYTSETLYHQAKTGNIQTWRCYVLGCTVFSIYGIDGGKLQTAMVESEAVNVGKSNELTAERHAIEEAKSMFQNKLDRKYRRTRSEAKERLPMPMLAHKYDENKAVFPADIQPKLDGVRCMAICVGDTVSLVSRSGKPYDVQHVSDYLETVMQDGDWLDGELYIHGESRQRIISLVKKVDRPGREKLQLWAYDCPQFGGIATCSWDVRAENLGRFCLTANDRPAFEVHTERVNSDKEAWQAHGRFTAMGFEGAVLRNLTGKFTFGSRSRDLLKLKKFLDDEFEVIKFEEGKGRMKGGVIWTCMSPAGEFRCTMKCTIKERQNYFNNGNTYIGRKLTVKYQHLSDDGIPQFPIGLVFRNDEDMP